jgi:tetratricopeptide (TPR) repeat protein
VQGSAGREACRNGQQEARAGRRRAALEAFRGGLRIDPDLIDCRAALATLLLREFHWDEAEVEFREALRRNADPRRRGLLLVGLGEALERAGRRPEAVPLYEEALALAPDSPPALGHLALARRAAGDLDGAVSAWKAYLEQRPPDSAALERLEEVVRLEAELRLLEERVRAQGAGPEDWDGLARARRSGGDPQGALAARRGAAALAPRDAGRTLALALAAVEVGRPEEAREALERALEIDPGRTAAWAHLARLAEEGGNRAEERRSWERLLEQHPLDLMALRRVAELERLDGRLPEAEREASRRAAGKNAGGAPALRLALLRIVAGDRPGAEEALASALERQPNEAAIQVAVGDLPQAAGVDRRRKGRGADAPETPPPSAPPASEIGRALLNLHKASGGGEVAAGIERLSVLVGRHADRVDLRVALGNALLAQGRLEEAAREYRRALEKAPADSSALLGLALAALRGEKYEEAERQARAAVAGGPRDPYALAALAAAAFQEGKRPDAEAAARAALEVDPWEEASGTRFILARTLAARGDLRAAEEVVRGDLPRSAWLLYDEAWRFARDMFLEDLPPARWEAWRRRPGELRGGEAQALPRIADLLASLEERYTRLRTPEETVEHYFSRRPDSSALVAGKTSEANRAVIARRLSENLAYLRLADFNSPEVSQVVKEVLQALKDAPGLVLDLRGNRGGLKDEARKVAEMLVPPDTLLEVEQSREGARSVRSPLGAGIYPDRPLVVLVDEDTASAAEALAGMLQSTGRATVVGDQTRGKGVSQAVRLLPGGYSLLVTASRTFDAAGRPLQGRGVVPQVPVAAPAGQSETSDPALEKARDLLGSPR